MSDSLLPAAESAWVSERARALGFDGCGVKRRKRSVNILPVSVSTIDPSAGQYIKHTVHFG